MRIIAGELGGRQFEAPSGHRTHPMSDKARGGLFSVLGDIADLTVLDAFAGSGALAFEALSRGAGQAVLVDSDKAANKTMAANIKNLGLTKTAKLIQANVSSWSDNNPDARFDIVLCDPPYDQLQLAVLQKLVRHAQEGGLYILSWPGELQLPEFVGLTLLKQKEYGDAQIVFYRR